MTNSGDDKDTRGTLVKGSAVDIYRDTPVRFLGYANEVGEAFRALVHPRVVTLSYVTAFAYVLADANDKTRNINQMNLKIRKGFDVLIWQTLASVAIPGFTINRICLISAILLRNVRTLSPAARKWTTTGIGLSCIPIIIKPIDHFVDWVMDKTYRKYWP